jgi:hypothetical protein
MFTIDLLKGMGKPPLSHPLRMAGVTVAFALVAIAAALDVVRYSRDNIELGLQARSLRYYTEEVTKLSGVSKALDAAEKRKTQINAGLTEVNTALTIHAKWSPIVVALTQSTTKEITITELMAKREEQGGGEQVKYIYSLILGVVSTSGPGAVEGFVQAMRQNLPLAPGPDNVRIIAQRQEMVAGRSFQYYVIECRLKP